MIAGFKSTVRKIDNGYFFVKYPQEKFLEDGGVPADFGSSGKTGTFIRKLVKIYTN